MNKKNMRTERIKNAAIVVLIVSAIFLGWKINLFSNFSESVPALRSIAGLFGLSDKSSKAEKKASNEAERPLCIAVTFNSDHRYGVKYDISEEKSMYERTATILGEALGSASAASIKETDEKSWQAALSTSGVFYEYPAAVKITVLGSWLGAKKVPDSWGNMTVRRLCVTFGDESETLYFQDCGTGSFYSVPTASLGNFSSVSGSEKDNGARFAFEINSLQVMKDQYMLLFTDDSSHPLIETKNPLSDGGIMDAVLAALGVSEHINSPYTENDGTLDYIENDFTLKIGKNGNAVYKRATSDEENGPKSGEGEMIETARSKVADTVAKYCGDAAVYFNSISSSGDGLYSVIFNYYVSGAEVFVGSNGYAAKVTEKNGKIEEMELNFRNYTISDENTELLPEIQAAAAAKDEFFLLYRDDGSGRLTPEWAVLPA